MHGEKSTFALDTTRGTPVLRMRGVLPFEYEILHVERPIFDPLERTLACVIDDRPALFVLDKNIETTYGTRLRQYVTAAGIQAVYTSLSGEESAKTWTQVEAVVGEAIRCELPRHGVVVAIGGGVTLDIAGLAATVYRRGICYVRVPTSLIGLVDAGLGIKHGINYGGYKSILGSFYPPEAVICDRSFLASLAKRHIVSGLAEIVKLGVIRAPDLLELLMCLGRDLVDSRFQRHSEVASAVLMRAEQVLLKELEGNLFESDLQRPLDFGHSFSPAIESASGYAILHGEAVAMDMALTIAIALRRGLCSEQEVQFLFELYERINLPVNQSVCGSADLMGALNAIRRHRGGALNFVVPIQLGRVIFLQDISRPDIEYALAYCDSVAYGRLQPGSGLGRGTHGTCDRF
jgi:2-epi-5-epi-valiolone synthase